MFSPIQLFVALGLALVADGGYWSYNGNEGDGPDSWTDTCKTGNHQSPIELSEPFEDVTYRVLEFHGYSHQYTNWQMINNGHSIQVNVPSTLRNPPFIRGGGLREDYQLLQFHFHWSQWDSNGSEHSINGQRFPLELHMVHGAKSNTSHLAVLSVLFRLGQSGRALVDIFSEVNKVQTFNTTDSLRRVDLMSKIPPHEQRFYRYDGSLTTPPCSEHVIWTIFTHQLTVTENELRILRRTKDETNQREKENDRPEQERNDRVVYLNRPEHRIPTPVCRENEVFQECEFLRHECDSLCPDLVFNPMPENGCRCVLGTFRNHQGNCVPFDQCEVVMGSENAVDSLYFS